MSAHPDWRGQNKPRIFNKEGYLPCELLPVMSVVLNYDEDSIYDLLPPPEAMGWEDNLTNIYAWTQSAYRVVQFIPDFERYGGIPTWFPITDGEGRLLTPQGQADRFLFLLNCAFGGLLDDHTQTNPRLLAKALNELHDNLGEYTEDEPEYELAR